MCPTWVVWEGLGAQSPRPDPIKGRGIGVWAYRLPNEALAKLGPRSLIDRLLVLVIVLAYSEVDWNP